MTALEEIKQVSQIPCSNKCNRKNIQTLYDYSIASKSNGTTEIQQTNSSICVSLQQQTYFVAEVTTVQPHYHCNEILPSILILYSQRLDLSYSNTFDS